MGQLCMLKNLLGEEIYVTEIPPSKFCNTFFSKIFFERVGEGE
jgi:hypothetical protein